MPAPNRRQVIGAGGAALAVGMTPRSATAAARPASKPLVFGHRGCCALRPEHTLASYAKAIADGADYIEPDLIITKDGVLIVRHENDLASTTDVARRPEFAARKATKTIGGRQLSGWFAEDFSLTEIKTLRTVERLQGARSESHTYDRRFQILTFDEVIDYVAAQATAGGRVVGIVPELKYATYFRRIGLPLEDRFLATLAAHDYTLRNPVEIQCGETQTLRYIRSRVGRPANVTLLQLMGAPDGVPTDIAAAGGSTTYGEMATPEGLARIASYADVISPPIRTVIPLGPDGRLGTPSKIVADAHAAGLLVRPFTFRPENRFLPADLRDGRGDTVRNEAGAIAEMRRYLAAGIDGFFTDDPALGRAAIDGQ